jgi:hypothetical protein
VVVRTTFRALFAIAFAFAITYASLCTLTCSLGSCIRSSEPAQETHHHHDSTEQSGTPSDHHSKDKDCSDHGHPDSFVKAPTAPQIDSGMVAWNGFTETQAFLPAAALREDLSFGRAHAPPYGSKEPLHLQISLLRI